MRYDSSGKWILIGRNWIRLSDGRRLPVIQGATQPSTVQNRFAFGDDDGSESGHSLDTENADRTAQVADVTFLIRIQIEEVNGKVDPWDFILRAAKNGGSYTDVTSARTDGLRLANDTQSRSDNEATTERLTAGSGSWLAGYYDDGTVEDGMGSTLSPLSQYSDLEFAIEIDSANATNDDYWDLEVYDQIGTALDVYTEIPRVTATGIATVINLGVGSLSANGQQLTVDAGGPDPGYSQHGFRIRSGDSVGLNVNSGWEAAEDINATIGTGVIFRVRFAMAREGTGVASQFKIQAKFNTGAWADLDIKDDISALATCIICLPSSQFTDAAAATQLLGTFGKTYTDGEGVAAVQDTGNILTASQDLDNLETEHEFCLMINSFFYDPQLSADQVQAGDTIELRLVQSDGTVFPNAYTSPVITVSETAGFIGSTTIESAKRVLFFDSGDLYALCEDNGSAGNAERMVLKSTNRGLIWREMDGAGRPTQLDWESGDAQLDGNVIYIASQLNNDAYHDSFNISTDLWVTTDEAIQTGVTRDDQVASIVRRSNGDLVAFWQEQVGADFLIRYKIKNGTWGTVANLDGTSGANYFDVIAVLGESDGIHIFYGDNTNGNLYHKYLTSGDVLDSDGNRDLIHNDVGTGGTDEKPILGAVYYDADGTERIVVAFRDESDGLVYTVKIDDNGTPGSAVVASDNTIFQSGVGNRAVTGRLVVDGKNLYIVYADITTQEIYLTKSIDYGSWNTDVKIIADVECDVITVTPFVPANGSLQIGICYEDGSNGANGFGRYIEYEQRPATTSIALGVGSLAANGKQATIDPGAAGGVVVDLFVGSMAANGQALDVIPGKATVSLGIGSLSSNGQALDVVPGLASISLGIGALAANGQQLDIIPGLATISLAVGALAAGGQQLDVIPGLVSISLGVGGLAANGQNLTVSIGITIQLGVGSLGANGQALDVIPGLAAIQLQVGALGANGQALTVLAHQMISLGIGQLAAGGQSLTVLAHQSISLGVGSLVSNGQSLNVIPGPVAVSLAVGSLSANGQTLIVLTGQTLVLLGVGSLSANGQALNVVPGPATISLAVGSLALNGQALQVLPGLVAISLQVGSLSANGQQATIDPGVSGLVVNLGVGSLVANGQALQVLPGLVAITMQVGQLAAIGQQLTITAHPPGLQVNLGVGQLSANGQTATILVSISIPLGVGSLGLNGQILNVVPGTVTIGLAVGALVMNGQTLVIVTAIHPDPGKVYYSHYREKRSFVNFDYKSGPVGPNEKRRL